MPTLIGPTQRGTGRTTREIEQAPMNAFYVCPSQRHCNYVKELARYLGRTDIWPVTPEYILDRRYCGSTRQIVLDHTILEYHPRAEELIIHALTQTRFIGPSHTSCRT